MIHKLKANKQITAQIELEELEWVLFDDDAISTKEQYTNSYDGYIPYNKSIDQRFMVPDTVSDNCWRIQIPLV